MSDVTSSTGENSGLSTSDLSSFSSAPAFEPAPTDVRERWQELTIRIRNNAALCYTAQPIISDAEYDEMFRQLQQLEEQWLDLMVPDSPTQQAGAQAEAPADGEVFKPVEHPERPYILDSVFNEQELRDWLAHTPASTYLAELKIDGLSIDLVCGKGRLVRATTRGDGRVEEDVTANARTVEDIPHEISGENVPNVLEVRGEVFISLEEFERINSDRVDAGQRPFANPHNAAAGSLR